MDSWVPDIGTLISYVASDVGIDVDISVVDMATADGVWLWNAFQHLLPNFVLLRIAAICGPKHGLPLDWISWDGSPNHRFSIKSAYTKRACISAGPHDCVWCIIQGFGGRNVHSAWTTLAAFCRFGLQGVRRKYTWPRVYSVAMADWQKRLI
ncbi:hypothetical protein V6N13_072908 [Hibiscus sabdariffa]